MVGIADVFREKADEILEERKRGEFGKMYDSCVTYASHVDMLKQANLDIVVIGTAPLHRSETILSVATSFLRQPLHNNFFYSEAL